MNAKVKKSFCPLSKQWGFLAKAENDAAWALSERDAVAKLLSRHERERAVVEWVNGVATLFWERGEG